MLKQRLEELGLSGHDKRLFWLLLLPSGFSGLLCVLISLAIVGWVFVAADFSGSALEQQVNIWRALNTEGDLSYYGEEEAFALDEIINNAMTFVMWGLLGAVVYLTVYGVASTVRHAQDLKEELDYVNSPKRHLVASTLFRFVLRIVVAVGWFMYIKFFFGTVALNSLAWLYDVAYEVTPVSAGYSLLAFLVLPIALHVHVVLLRLLALRPRLFGGNPE